MHTVFLVEDEPLIRQNMRNAIEKSARAYTCIGEAGDGELALSIIQDLKPYTRPANRSWNINDKASLS